MNKNKLSTFIPALNWAQDYSPKKFRGDLNAGITVGIMLIPQGMAYAALAGMPPVYGLYASIVPLILYAILGTSRQLAVGPVAMVSLLIVAGVGEFAEIGSDRFIQLAILAAFGVGMFQFLMGLFRMGFIVNFLSHPVLSGFTSAAALIIGASQIKGLLGIDLPRTNYVHEIIIGTAGKLSEIDLFTTLIGIGSIAVIVLIKKWKRTFPSALIVVFLGTLVTAVFGLNDHGVSIVGEIPEGLPSFNMVAFSWADFQLLIPTILVISLVGYMESIAVAKAIANKHGYKVDANQELIGLGAANIGGSFFQSFPVTGGFSRTAVNDQAGANTGMASIISAIIIGLTVLLLTPLFYYLPSAVLAAIIIVAVAGLFDAQEMKVLWKTDRRDLMMLFVTFIATLALGIEEGILVGVVISLIAVVYSSTKPHSTELGRLGNSPNYRNVDRYKEAIVDDDVLIYRFDSPLFFANTDFFQQNLQDHMYKKKKGLKAVVLDASSVNSIDSTGLHTLKETINVLREQNVQMFITGAIGPVRDKLKKGGILDYIGEENLFFDVADAMDFLQKNGKEIPAGFSPSQTNC